VVARDAIKSAEPEVKEQRHHSCRQRIRWWRRRRFKPSNYYLSAQPQSRYLLLASSRIFFGSVHFQAWPRSCAGP